MSRHNPSASGALWFLRGISAILLLSLTGCVSNGPSADDQRQAQVDSASPVLTVNSFDLASDYASNEIAADQKYKDKVILVTGSVDTVGGSGYVVFTGSREVDCMFRGDERIAALAHLSKGQNVQIKGVCTGKQLATTFLDFCSVKQ